MIKVLGSPERKRWIGDTAGLLNLKAQGRVLRYEVQTDVPEYAVEYAPRSKRDPMPWVQVGGLESRLKSGEIVAIDADTFAAWKTETDAETDEWVESVERASTPVPEAPAGPRYTVAPFEGRFTVYDTQSELGVADFFSRYAANDKAERLNAGPVAPVIPAPRQSSCIHGRHLYKSVGGTEIPLCESGSRYGVWDNNDAGFVHVEDCAQSAANWAGEQLYADSDSDLKVMAVCPDHEEQPANGCEDCNGDGCGAVDSDDLDACGKCRDCNPREFD